MYKNISSIECSRFKKINVYLKLDILILIYIYSCNIICINLNDDDRILYGRQ